MREVSGCDSSRGALFPRTFRKSEAMSRSGFDGKQCFGVSPIGKPTGSMGRSVRSGEKTSYLGVKNLVQLLWKQSLRAQCIAAARALWLPGTCLEKEGLLGCIQLYPYTSYGGKNTGRNLINLRPRQLEGTKRHMILETLSMTYLIHNLIQKQPV